MGALAARCVLTIRVTLRRFAALKLEILVNSGKLIDLMMFFDGQVNTADAPSKTSVIRYVGQ